jgi:hypothetical protein
MSSPSYEIFFRDAPFNDLAAFINTFAEQRHQGNRSYWTFPPGQERFDLLIEPDDAGWDEFVQEDVDIEFFISVFKNKRPACSVYLEGRKWAGAQGILSMRETVITLLSRFDGLFATEEQLFTLDDLDNAAKHVPATRVVDYRAIHRTDDLLTRKRVALGIRETLQFHCLSDPWFEPGDDRTRAGLMDELIRLGEAAVPVMAPWLGSENKGLAAASAEIIRRIGGETATTILKRARLAG